IGAIELLNSPVTSLLAGRRRLSLGAASLRVRAMVVKKVLCCGLKDALHSVKRAAERLMQDKAKMSRTIDAHHHMWRYSAAEYEWIDDSMSELRRDFVTEDLERELAAATVD